MQYISTRGQANKVDFEGALLAGLASDGGLYVPEKLPTFSEKDLREMAKLDYPALALRVIKPFVGDCIPEADLKAMLDETYGSEIFHHSAVAPLKQLSHNAFVLELFHGPTLAFKDFALQLLGRLLDYVLERHEQKVVIVGATSGDTGSAAIHGCKDCKNVSLFILHPKGRVSDVQRKQMTTVLRDNVHNLALEGNFDDCQAIVKTLFGERHFLGDGTSLVAVNSINWARIMAQIVYYFYAAFALGGPDKSVAFSVPTGNFGDIFAGYLAKKMGLPIHQLIIATNQNDILHRFLSENKYERGKLVPSLSPSMDIQVSSNFERLLFDLYDQDGDEINRLMTDFAKGGNISIESKRFEKMRALFSSARINDTETLETIARIHQQSGEVLDPHSAIGVEAAYSCERDVSRPVVALATAHPAKFPDAIKKAGVAESALPAHLAALLEGEERMQVLSADATAVKEYILKHV